MELSLVPVGAGDGAGFCPEEMGADDGCSTEELAGGIFGTLGTKVASTFGQMGA